MKLIAQLIGYFFGLLIFASILLIHPSVRIDAQEGTTTKASITLSGWAKEEQASTTPHVVGPGNKPEKNAEVSQFYNDQLPKRFVQTGEVKQLIFTFFGIGIFVLVLVLSLFIRESKELLLLENKKR